MRRFVRLAAAALFTAPSPASGQDGVVALTNAEVVDVVRGTIASRQTIIVRSGRIEEVGPSSVVRIPRAATRVNVAGKFVIPGLWDMHVHLGGGASDVDALKYYGSLFLANGVTGVRDAGAGLARLRALDSLGVAEPGTMPRLVYAGEKIGPPPGGPWSIADARAAIRGRLAAGARYAKLAPEYPAPLFRETLGACAAMRTQCVSHVPAADTAIWLSAPGRGSYEHLFNLAEHVSRVPAADLFEVAREYAAPTLVERVLYKLRLRRRPPEPSAHRLAMRDTTKDEAFFRRVAESGTWITPTLVLHHFMQRAADILPAAVDTSLSVQPLGPSTRSGTQKELSRGLWHMFTSLVRAMHGAGVQMLSGTDFSPFHVPGAALHAEMLFLQQSGVPPAAVLRAATINPARYLGAVDTLGSVASGRVADLVVLRRNPLDDVRHVTEIEMMMTRGRLLRRGDLDRLTSSARAARGRMRAGDGQVRR
ncbi:MAG TPA: amidohydrolase family protein [Gemmatimonadaceae bacterium]